MSLSLRTAAWLALPLAALACSPSSRHRAPRSAATASFDASVATRWFELLYDVVKSNAGQSPPVAARTYGYAGVTLYESVVPGMSRHRSLAGQLNEWDGVPQSQGVVDYRAVANTALAAVIRGGIVLNLNPANQAAVDALETTINGELALDVSAHVLQRSNDHGAVVAAAILAWAAGDGYSVFNNCAYTPPVATGLWVPLPGQTALQPCWDLIRPFVLLPASECAATAPHPYSEVIGQPFRDEADEVLNTTGDAGANLTADQNAIAFFWSDGPGGTGTPPGHWISITSQICDADDETLEVAAEAYAKLGIAVADAFIACWQTKYQHSVERPITYLQRVTSATWDPLLATPAFPEYTSGHSVQSGAAATVMTDVLGPRAFVDETHANHGNTVGPGATIPPSRSFSDLFTAADEAGISRLYGGIHFRAAIDHGLAQGNCIGNEVLTAIEWIE